MNQNVIFLYPLYAQETEVEEGMEGAEGEEQDYGDYASDEEEDPVIDIYPQGQLFPRKIFRVLLLIKKTKGLKDIDHIVVVFAQ